MAKNQLQDKMGCLYLELSKYDLMLIHLALKENSFNFSISTTTNVNTIA